MILCCGEALVDMLPNIDGCGTSNGRRPVLGGSIFNTARVAARLGLDTAFVSSVSTDEFGDLIHASLEKSGVVTDYVRRVARPTALAFVDFNDGQAEYRFEEAGSASRMMTKAELPGDPSDCALAHFGSISLVTEPCATALENFAIKLSTQSVIAVDPNIRPAFILNREQHMARLERVFELADIIKLSDEDLDWFETDAETTASRWLSGRTSLIVVTRGASGVTGFSARGRIDLPAADVKVVDTVGAGDAFSAGLYAGLNQAPGLDREKLSDLSLADFESALALGVQTSGKVVQQAGAELPFK